MKSHNAKKKGNLRLRLEGENWQAAGGEGGCYRQKCRAKERYMRKFLPSQSYEDALLLRLYGFPPLVRYFFVFTQHLSREAPT